MWRLTVKYSIPLCGSGGECSISIFNLLGRLLLVNHFVSAASDISGIFWKRSGSIPTTYGAGPKLGMLHVWQPGLVDIGNSLLLLNPDVQNCSTVFEQ